MKTPALWDSKNILSTLLLPLSWLYALCVQLRWSFTSPETLSVPVICVGNLTAGGGGKTPVALYVGQRLRQKNVKAFFLSRGHGGSLQGPAQVDPARHGAREVGDEPLLLAGVLPTIISKDRVRGAYYAIALGAEAIVMDDGLQNPTLTKSLSLLVVNAKIGFGNRRMLPAGPLRQTMRSGFARTDALVLIGGNRLTGIPADLPVLFASAGMNAATEGLRGRKALAFCGLAYPQKFFDALKAAGVSVIETKSFGDHHLYSEKDFRRLLARATELEATLVTTAKDAARLTPRQRVQVAIVDVELAFDDPEALDALLDEAMGRT